MNKVILNSVSLVLALVVGLAGCTAQPVTVTKTLPAETVTKTVEVTFHFAQVLISTIEPYDIITDYVSYLRTGDQVTGVVQLAGLLDGKSPFWSFSIFYRVHDQESSFVHHWQTFSKDDKKHAFGFTAEQDGEYILRISVSNSTSLDVRLDITPGGWR